MGKQTRLAIICFVSIFIGIGVSVYLTSHHYDLMYGQTEAKSFCNINAKVDCDAVNTSAFSEIFGIPVAMVAGFAFIVEFFLLLGVQAFSEEEKRKIARFFYYLCAGNLAATLLMAVFSSVILKTYCVMCMTIWLVSFILFFCARGLASNMSFGVFADDVKSLFRSSKNDGARAVLFMFLLVPVGSALSNAMWKQSISGDLDKMVEKFVADWQTTPKIDFFIKDSPEFGNPQAAMQIVEFSDFQCPHCKRAAPSLHAFVNSHRDSVHFIFQNYPLDPACNKIMSPGTGHDQACRFAKAALCANKQGQFIEAHDWIFAHQDTLSEDLLSGMVDDLKLDKNQFKTCMDGQDVSKELEAQLDRGQQAGIQGTPSIFVNGRLLQGGFIIPVLEAVYKSINR